MAKEKLAITVEVPKSVRKRAAPKTAFVAGGENPHAFQKGRSGNPSGRPKDETRLLSKTVRRQLGDRAPNETAETLGLDAGANWAQVLAATLIRRAVAGSMPAAQLLATLTEPAMRGGSSAVGGIMLDENGEPAKVPDLAIHFVGTGKPLQPHYLDRNVPALPLPPADCKIR